MLIGALQVELYIPGSQSLKEKRFVLKSIKTKIRNRFNVSVAEVDQQDKWQRATLGISCVSNDRRLIDEILSKVQNLLMNDSRIEVTDQVTEIL